MIECEIFYGGKAVNVEFAAFHFQTVQFYVDVVETGFQTKTFVNIRQLNFGRITAEEFQIGFFSSWIGKPANLPILVKRIGVYLNFGLQLMVFQTQIIQVQNYFPTHIVQMRSRGCPVAFPMVLNSVLC